ncbi:hypothetical protein M011DRAFT_18911 [Sporormia fimetaria CBS 119925]|uniref:Uncharacterized protein n=1 Tax=Sporormia fimetaria CBS 119925 TaxID=1340428 RepID=A0A6A6VNN2_9PLEO|nr:hypothetical protein M011DRAFT_18911 [Sporormia fimetaria CBS 119925]
MPTPFSQICRLSMLAHRDKRKRALCQRSVRRLDEDQNIFSSLYGRHCTLDPTRFGRRFTRDNRKRGLASGSGCTLGAHQSTLTCMHDSASKLHPVGGGCSVCQSLQGTPCRRGPFGDGTFLLVSWGYSQGSFRFWHRLHIGRSPEHFSCFAWHVMQATPCRRVLGF